MDFRKYRLPKTWLDQCLTSLLSEEPSKSNMVNELAHFQNLRTRPLPSLLMIPKAIASQKGSVSDMQNLKTFS